jgi:SPP1 family phage portal protein
LEDIGDNESARMAFVEKAINEHRMSESYHIAADAEAYYAKRNVTIGKFQKFLYTMQGKAVPDLYSANYKTKTAFFRSMVIQQTQYVLSNGVTFEGKDTKDKLGADFDYQIQKAAKKAMIDGVSFCFFNFDHVEVFGYADTPSSPGFAPLFDAKTALLRAGIRYWYTGSDTDRSTHATLYEEDGYTSYIKDKDGKMEVTEPKRGYIQTSKASGTGDEGTEYSNYPGFPIVPMYANDLHESELIGLRESIDCYDFIKNGLANDIDDTNGIYWTLKNSGGVSDMDLAQFIERLRVVKAAAVDDPDADIQAHTLDIPVEARSKMLEILKTDLYRDAMLLDIDKALSGNMTATAMRLAYQAQDDKCGDFEFCISKCIARLLELAGIKDYPKYKWNRIANQLEETQMVLMAANYLDEKAVLNHLPWIMPEEVDEILKRKAAEDMERLTAGEDEDEPEEVNKDGEREVS